VSRLEAVWTILRSRHWRWGGFMFATRDERSAFGSPGSRGRSFKLTIWRNP
jgi:hypothetical protein